VKEERRERGKEGKRKKLVDAKGKNTVKMQRSLDHASLSLRERDRVRESKSAGKLVGASAVLRLLVLVGRELLARYAVRLVEPGAEIDQAAALAAERPPR
jgi:hypothetical protein